MATANRFQTRVFIPDKSLLSTNEIRLNSLLNQAQKYVQTLKDLQQIEYNNDLQRKVQLNDFSKKLLDKIDSLYKSCSNDLKQSYDQLKSFTQIIHQILNNEKENNLDGNKLSAIEHELCLLKCLTYQLDITKVKIEGNFKLNKNSDYDKDENSIDDEVYDNELNQNNEKLEKKDFNCRILVHKDTIEKIENLSLFQEFIQMTENEINEETPERILTITDSHLNVLKQILDDLYPSTASQRELRILLHESYAPFILGKLGDRSKILREKYSLHTITIHPTCAPKSSERVFLIQGSSTEKILSCLEEIFINIKQNRIDDDDINLYNEINYEASAARAYGGFASSEIISRSNEQQNQHYEEDEEYEDDSVRRYSAFDAWNGSVEADVDQELSVVKLGDDCIMRQFWINHGQFGALLGPHGVRIAQIRSQCRTVRIHTVAGSSIDTCSVKVIGPRADVNHAVNLIFQSIKEHDRKFPFKHHRFSGRLR